MKNIYYFWLAPTLTYQICFPKVPRVRLRRVIGILCGLSACFTLFILLIAQFVTPTLDSLVIDLEKTQGVYTARIFAEYWLKLAIANTYLWLLMFYVYFHLYLNLWAELLRFGDRVFYKDWWNSSELGSYWRLWNQPVHFW
jgi:diacylglycerol O-acyltransferase-1